MVLSLHHIIIPMDFYTARKRFSLHMKRTPSFWLAHLTLFDLLKMILKLKGEISNKLYLNDWALGLFRVSLALLEHAIALHTPDPSGIDVVINQRGPRRPVRQLVLWRLEVVDVVDFLVPCQQRTRMLMICHNTSKFRQIYLLSIC